MIYTLTWDLGPGIFELRAAFGVKGFDLTVLQYPKNLAMLKTQRVIRKRGFDVSRLRYFTWSPDPSLVDARNAPKDFTPGSAVVYQSILSQEEGNVIVQDISALMKRRRYEKGHWDSVISNYKEVELSDLLFERPEIPTIYHRVRQHLETNHLENDSIQWLPCHAIDLKKDGKLNAHVDSIKFSGGLVAGISLLSPSIMRLLVPDDGTEAKATEDEGWVDLYLPPLSLYVLTGVGRYRYSHQLLPDNSMYTKPDGTEIAVIRDHRLSVIFRDSKVED